jgi:integrase/recombinase XerD
MLEFCFMESAMQKGSKGAYDSVGRRKYLTKSEGLKFMRCAARTGDAERLLCETLYYSGCRISEALALGPEDIDATQAVIRILSLKKRDKPQTRRVPVPPRLANELKSLSLKPEEKHLWNYSRATAWRIVKRVMHQAGIEGIHATAKGLRHGFGVRAAMGKVPVNIIQRWMGHADPSTTAIYLAVRDDEERELIKRTW